MGNKVYRKWRRKTSEDSYSLTDWLFHVRDFQCYFRFLLFCKTVASLAANRYYGQRLNATLIKNNLKLTTTVFIMGTWVKCRNKSTTKQGTAHEEFINETRSPLLFPNWILTIYEVQIRQFFHGFRVFDPISYPSLRIVIVEFDLIIFCIIGNVPNDVRILF